MCASANPLLVRVFDYGAGNLHSLVKSLMRADVRVEVTTNPHELSDTGVGAVILPGVGAFAPAAERLAPAIPALREALLAGRPCLGICLGLQLLADGSDEGEGQGVGVFPGRVTRLSAERVPQIGWNTLEHSTNVPRLGALAFESAYYANSFVYRPSSEAVGFVSAWSTHERDRFPAIVQRAHVVGVQFHPEKSSHQGVGFVQAFLDNAARVRREH
jgi:glutamine amidotransferase